MGKIVESKVVEGDPRETLKDLTLKALREWDPLKSDFVVMRHVRRIGVEELDSDSQKYSGDLVRVEGDEIVFPVYMISFDNETIDDEDFVDYKIYLVSPYISETLRTLLEVEAAEATAVKRKPEGIKEY